MPASKELPLSIASTIYRQAAGSSTSAGIRTTFEAARAGANSSFRSASGVKPQHQAKASSSSRILAARANSRMIRNAASQCTQREKIRLWHAQLLGSGV
eukprot:COSAG06_NODE_1292_length_9980_cov_3.025908_4_plen_99_part_00